MLGEGIVNDISTSMLKYLCDNLEYFKYFFSGKIEKCLYLCMKLYFN